MKDKTLTTILYSFICILFLFIVGVAEAGNTIIPVNTQAQYNGVAISKGNSTFFIYDLSSSGTKMYQENFNDSISQGLLQVMLGYQNESLALTAGNIYFMDMWINGQDTNATVNGTNVDRFPFVAPVSAYQSLNVSKLIVNSNDADDAINVTGGAVFGNGVFGGSLTVKGNDADDAFNVSDGASYFAGIVSIKKFFNITPSTSQMITNGTVTTTSADTDDALNVSTGGAYIKGNLNVGGAITGGGGLASQDDVEWDLISWTNYSARTGGLNVSNIMPSNYYKMTYYINVKPLRCDNNASDSFANGVLAMRINNVTGNSYNQTLFTGTGFTAKNGVNNFTLATYSASTQPTVYNFGTVYFTQLNIGGNNTLLVNTNSFITSGQSNQNNLLFGAFLDGTKLSDINFVTSGALNAPGCEEYNGSVMIYAHRSFNKY